MDRIRKSLLVACVLGLGLLPSPANGVIGTPDPVPAATLLFPYFEVDLTNPSGITTLLAVSNTNLSAALVNVVIWSDYGIPVFRFNIYLTGYDVQAINLRDILVNGVIPRTASDLQDPADTISPQGPISQDITFASCNGLPPANLTAGEIGELQKALKGQLVTSLGGCASRSWGDQIARGYVTMDTVNSCSAHNPSTAGYFSDPIVTYQNVLAGDWMLVDSGSNFAQGELAVHIEASTTDSLTTTPGSYTFYGRFVSGNASDHREPLATTWGASSVNRFLPGASAGSRLLVWRDPGKPVFPFPCATAPSPFPMAVGQILAFDSQSNGAPVASNPFFTAAQRVEVGDDLPMTAKAGWFYLNLNATTAGGFFGGIKQSWVTPIHDEGGRYSGGWTPVALGLAATSSNVVLAPIP